MGAAATTPDIQIKRLEPHLSGFSRFEWDDEGGFYPGALPDRIRSS
jgi:hypothetical protein